MTNPLTGARVPEGEADGEKSRWNEATGAAGLPLPMR